MWSPSSSQPLVELHLPAREGRREKSDCAWAVLTVQTVLKNERSWRVLVGRLSRHACHRGCRPPHARETYCTLLIMLELWAQLAGRPQPPRKSGLVGMHISWEFTARLRNSEAKAPCSTSMASPSFALGGQSGEVFCRDLNNI